MTNICRIFIFSLILSACTSIKEDHRARAQQNTNKIDRRAASENSELEYRRSIIVHKNDGKKLEIEIGQLHTDQKIVRMFVFFGDKALKYGVNVEQGDKFSFPIEKTGHLRIYFKRRTGWDNWLTQYWVIWDQRIFVQKDLSVSREKLNKIANTFSPIILTPEEERYYPVTLEYLFNITDKDPDLDKEIFHLKVKKESRHYTRIPSARNRDIYFPFKDVLKVIPFNGDNLAVLNIPKEHRHLTKLQKRYGSENETALYYSYFEKDEFLYINYHTFYTYDPKNTADASGAHAFDRESITLVYNLKTNKAERLFYGAHLASQKLGIIDKNGTPLQKWNGGRVFLNWDNVPKVNQKPVIVSAYGSHAFFPFPADYQVYLKSRISLLTEKAGGDRILYPASIEKNILGRNFSSKSRAYKLIDLNMGKITSFSWNNALLFGGDLVDVLDIPFLTENASFPPYTDREVNIFNYTNPKKSYEWRLDRTPKESRTRLLNFIELLK